jgi:hypothetical protein
MELPKDPAMLLSFVNTKLRDFYDSLEQMCLDMELDQNMIKERLKAIDYEYDEAINKFV